MVDAVMDAESFDRRDESIAVEAVGVGNERPQRFRAGFEIEFP
jgi:hypothetical protein